MAAVAAGRAFGITADAQLHVPGVTQVSIGGDEFSLRVRLVWRAPGPPPEVRAAIETALGEGLR